VLKRLHEHLEPNTWLRRSIYGHAASLSKLLKLVSQLGEVLPNLRRFLGHLAQPDRKRTMPRHARRCRGGKLVQRGASKMRDTVAGVVGARGAEEVAPSQTGPLQRDSDVHGERIAGRRGVHHALWKVEHFIWSHHELLALQIRVLHGIFDLCAAPWVALLQLEYLCDIAFRQVRKVQLLGRQANTPVFGTHDLHHEHVIPVGVGLEGGRPIG